MMYSTEEASVSRDEWINENISPYVKQVFVDDTTSTNSSSTRKSTHSSIRLVCYILNLSRR